MDEWPALRGELRQSYEARFIHLADEINRSMPDDVVELVIGALNQRRGARILALGVAYKRGVGDTRESPALEVLDRLREHGAEVAYADPYVPSIVVVGITLKPVEPDDREFAAADCGFSPTTPRSTTGGSSRSAAWSSTRDTPPWRMPAAGRVVTL